MQRRDIGVIQRREQTGLTVEATAARRIIGDHTGEHLDRDLAAQSCVVGAIHLAHAAHTELAENFVRSDAASWIQLQDEVDYTRGTLLFTPRRITETFAVLVLLLAGSLSARAAGAAVMVQNPTVEAAVSAALERYSTALESLDADSVKKVQPAIDVDSLKKAFKEMRALDVTIADLKVLSSDATVVRVSCKVTQTLTPRAGSKHTTAVNRVVRLKKHDTGFVIDAFER